MIIQSIHIDWLSICFPMEPKHPTEEQSEKLFRAALGILRSEFGQTFANLIESLEFEQIGSRAPYLYGVGDKNHGVFLWVGVDIPHFTIEFSGLGCQLLRDNMMLQGVIEGSQNHLTRLDLALDLDPEGITIPNIMEGRRETRIRSQSHFMSTTGQTWYLGSKTSDKYLRCYEYFEPHPRAGSIRFEFVLRRQQARAGARLIGEVGESGVAKGFVEYFGLGGLPINWNGQTAFNIIIPKQTRSQATTLIWLIKQAAPAFKRLVQEEAITDAEDFIRRYFLDDSLEQL